MMSPIPEGQKKRVRMSKRDRIWFCIFLFALAVYTIKNLFIGADTDEGYGIVLGYRLAKGDRLLLEMWEPHQTSGIFTALLIRPFLWVMGSNDFLNLYLRIVYFVIHGAVTYCCYRILRTCVAGLSQEDAVLPAMIFYLVSPKCIYIPEYSNLHIWFFALFCFCLMQYYCAASPGRGKKSLLAAAGAFLCCDVLTYPSMVLLFFVCLVFIFCFRRKNLSPAEAGKLQEADFVLAGNGKEPVKEAFAECLVFVLPSVAAALVFVGYVMSYMTVSQVLQVIPYILEDGTHRIAFRQKALEWLESCGEAGLILAVCGAGALILVYGGHVLLSAAQKQNWRRYFGNSGWGGGMLP